MPRTDEIVVCRGRTALWWVGGLAVALTALSTGCQNPPGKVALAQSPFSAEHPARYELYPGDELYIRFPTNPGLDQAVRIRSDGMVSLPHIGDIQAAQRMPEELATDVEDKLFGIIQKPEATVIVTSELGRRAYIGGEVQRPGAIPLHPNQTVTQAVFEAGGVLGTAKRNGVLIVRHRLGDATYVLKADLARILAGQDPDVQLEPYDIVYVPETSIAKVGWFVEQYINRVIPRVASFPFITELATQPVRVVGQESAVPPVTVTR